MKKNNNENKEKSKSFLEKMKDSKYKAKVEFIGYGVLILILLIYLNVVNSTSSNTLIQNDNSLKENIEQEEVALNLLEKISDNYEYDIQIHYVQNNDSTSDVKEEKDIHYFGKSFSNQLVIQKEVDQESKIYYKVDDFYYQENADTNSQGSFELVDDSEVYSFLDRKYIEFDNVKKYIDKASLDHVTNYSSGKKEEVYHLKIKDVIKSYQDDTELEISVTTVDEQVVIRTDYAVLLHVIDASIVKCKVEFTYTNIGKVEEFQVMNEESKDVDS